MTDQNRPCQLEYMMLRGGSSKGLYFNASDLPKNEALRDQILLDAMGRDHRQIDGNPGYFAVQLNVYNREGQQCSRCLKTNIQRVVLGGRSSFFCPKCQQF